MGLLAWIILGGLAGWLASKVVGKRSGGLVLNIVVGVVGALIGGLVVEALGGSGITGFNFYSLAVAIFGSVILLAIVRFATPSDK